MLTALVLALAAPPPSPISHDPARPKSGQAVTITARLPAEYTKATLKLQFVEPGQYIRKTDPAYNTTWTDFPMSPGGDGSFTATVPGPQQSHRRLVRYRVVAVAANGQPITWPNDPHQPNEAYWVDDGPMAWTGRLPRSQTDTVYSAAFLGTLQPMTLIAHGDDVAKSQWDGQFHKQKQAGTLVYQGRVYDHIQYSNRGQGSAHISGKNKWDLKFAKGHDVPMLNHDGKPFPAPIEGLNLNPGGSTPHLPIHRGITGLDEVLSMRTYRLAGVPAPPATWIQWRVVTTKKEGDPNDPYVGDLWGPYVAVGEMDPALLADGGLMPGLVVSAQSGIKYRPKDMPDGDKLWEEFQRTMRANPREDWWRANLDLSAMGRFHALNRLLGNVDLRPDGNHGYYRRRDGRWAPIPWDNDMMFVPRHHQPGIIDANFAFAHPGIGLVFRNHAREILDLFAADADPRGGQIGQLVADLGRAIQPPGHAVDWAGLDAAKWNRHPRMLQRDSYFINPAQGFHFGGPWTRTLATNDFKGFQKYIVDFCTDSRPTKNYAPNDGDARGYGWGYLALEAKDDRIPRTPTVTRSGSSWRFEVSAYASPSIATAAALEWRIARVGEPDHYELTPQAQGEVATATSFTIPAMGMSQPGRYRVRARWRDSEGRCSHWSPPVTIPITK